MMMEGWSGGMWNESNGNFPAMNQSDNLSISCVADNVEGPFQLPYSTTLTNLMRGLVSTYLMLVLVVGVGLNILVISMIIWFEKLKTFIFGIMLQVTTVDLLLLILVLVRLVSSISNQWVFGEHICAVTGALLDIFLTQRLLLMSVFVSNRLLHMSHPRLYTKLRLKVAAHFSLASWLIPVVIYITSLGLDCYTFVPELWSCGMSYDCSDVCATYSRVIFGFLTPVKFAIAISYVVVYRRAKRAAKNTENNAAAECQEYYQKEPHNTKMFLLFHVIFTMITAPQSLVEFISDNIIRTSDLPVVLYVVATLAEAATMFQVIIDPLIILTHPDMKRIIKSCLEREKVDSAIKLSSLESSQ